MILIDTHVASWLRADEHRRLKPVKTLLEREDVRLSPFVVFELQVLFEIGRIRETGRWIATKLAEDHGISIYAERLAESIDRARDLSFTRDPFDRLIAAHALAAGAELLTVDQTLREHVAIARWP